MHDHRPLEAGQVVPHFVFVPAPFLAKLRFGARPLDVRVGHRAPVEDGDLVGDGSVLHPSKTERLPSVG
jgi:hypothetical protein